MNAEVAVAINLKGLDSSEDEDLIAGASAGTGEPQQYQRVQEYRKSEAMRYLGIGTGTEILSRRDSAQSGRTSNSETSD